MPLDINRVFSACAAVSVLMAAACSPVPTSIHFPDGSMTVESLDKVPVPAVQVVDKNGQPIEPAPIVSWDASPAKVVTVDGNMLVPGENGEGVVRASVGEISGETSITVAVPTLADKLFETTSLSAALGLMKSELADSYDDLDPGTVMLAFWAANNLEWSDVNVAKDETSYKLVQKDSTAQRGKRLCIRGAIIQIEKAADGLFEGLMFDGYNDIFKIYAVKDTGTLVQGNWGRFCGFVTGKYSYANSGGGTSHAVSIIGMYELPSNK
ncbi:MAG TPA: hypothetical protein QGF58_25145 [Myxococcota bacterium]|nr:hypothetical protein [Myxococcota bacterium]